MLGEFKVEDRRVQWLASEDVSERRVAHSFGTYLKGEISGGLRYSTPEDLSVAKTLDDVQC